MRPKRIWAWPDVWDSEHGVWASDPQGTPKKQYEYIHIDEHNLRLREVVEEALNREDIRGLCGLCGLPGADKVAHPIHWPGERIPDCQLVHCQCEEDECRRAYAVLSDAERQTFLRSL